MSWGNIDDFQGFHRESDAWQLDRIDGLLLRANIDQEQKDIIHALKFGYSYDEANETIEYLEQNQIIDEPREIWKNRIKNKN